VPKFKIIQPQGNKLELTLAGLVSIGLLLTIISALSKFNEPTIAGFLVVWVSIFLWILLRQTGLLKRYRTDGILSLNIDRIEIDGTSHLPRSTFLLKDHEITVHFRGYKGQWIGRYYCYGEKNELLIKGSSRTLQIRFLVGSDEQVGELKSMMRTWYATGVKIKETGLRGQTSFLLDTDLPYNELRAIKAELMSSR